MCVDLHLPWNLDPIYSSETIQWKTKTKKITVKPFRSVVGPRVPVPCSIIAIFQLFFTSSLLEMIVEETNKYAAECMGASAYTHWERVTVEELTAFFGFMILMGLISLPALSDYWKKDELFHYQPIASRISRDRFFQLQRYLHFADNATLSPPGSTTRSLEKCSL